MSLQPWNTAPGRSIDIELGGQEVINIELDNLDANADDVLEVLREGRPKVSVWTRLAGEYLREGHLDAAEKIAKDGLQCFAEPGSGHAPSLPSLYSLLANIELAKARKAPKVKLPNARQDVMTHEKSRDEHMREATRYLNECEKICNQEGIPPSQLFMLTRATYQLSNRSLDDALREFEAILSQYPRNLIALMGKARILYARRQFALSLKAFQQVLQLNPSCLPDPRIGIGLCLWALNHKEKAKAAWQRSIEVNPNEWSAQLLLGIEALNSSKSASLSEAERAHEIMTGTKMIERAFMTNQRNAAAANALCDIFLRKGQYKRALKLAERTIQFADTVTLLNDGYIRAGRVCHSEGSFEDATKHFTTAAHAQPKNVLAAIGLAQMQMHNGEIPAAIHTLDTLLQPPNPQRSLEATVMLASLRAHPRPGVSSSDAAAERVRARELFDRVAKAIEQRDDQHAFVIANNRANGHANQVPPQLSRLVANDIQMYIEIAKLWQNESLEKTSKAFSEGLRISEAVGEGSQGDPRLLNNLGVLAHLEGKTETATGLYEKALMGVSVLGSSLDGAAGADGEAMSTSILYNLARIYEDIGEHSRAGEAYEKLLERHPEYVDAKVRQAHMLSSTNRHAEAHDLLKQCLTAQPSNLNLRAYYAYFLIISNSVKLARDFVFSTLKDHDKHDVYALCAVGWVHYHLARENRDNSPKAIEERKKFFLRSAEFYVKALDLDPNCAVAAQGLAIITAEDALGSLGGSLPPGPQPDDAQRRVQNARDALDVFAKVRESIDDGSVYVNMGHCYYARDEYDRAIECYETASKRYYSGQNVSTLQCLCRSWYGKANKDQSFVAMNTALSYAQKALHIQPTDKSILYNIAMIQQKAAEMLFSIPAAKRTLKDLQRAIEQAGHAQKLFATLATDPSAAVPYSKEIADQRRKYGDSMLRRQEEHLAQQREYEQGMKARLDLAKKRRQEEREKQEAIERERMAAIQEEAEKLAEARRLAREETRELLQRVQLESDDERERKAKKAANKKVKSEVVSGDEAPNGEGPPRKKKRVVRKGKKEKGATSGKEGSDAEDGALFSGGEELEKPVKKRTKKRVVRDDDDEEPEAAPSRKKQYKSKEIISSSDDEDMS